MKLRKGQKVIFKAICNLTGKELELKGVVFDEGYNYIAAHQDIQKEHGNIRRNEAYIIKENSHSVKLHLVLIEDVLKVIKSSIDKDDLKY